MTKLEFWERPEFERYIYLLQERESVRQKKLAGAPKPWTDDEILQMYRFTNMRRMDDKVSLWLLDNWYKPYKDHPNMLPAVLMARFFNLPDALDELTELVFSEPWPEAKISLRLRLRKESGDRIFNNAYMVRGNDGQDKVDTIMHYTIKPMIDNPPTIYPESMRRTWESLAPRYGMASFMAGQVVADLRWAMTGTWEDKGYWAPAGPGSIRGICRLHGKRVQKTMPQWEFLEKLTLLVDVANDYLPDSLVGRMEMADWQSTLCEFDKYERVLNGQGKPKQRYPGL